MSFLFTFFLEKRAKNNNIFLKLPIQMDKSRWATNENTFVTFSLTFGNNINLRTEIFFFKHLFGQNFTSAQSLFSNFNLRLYFFS